MRKLHILTILLLLSLTAMAQSTRSRFFNLTAEEVRIDSVIPHAVWQLPLGAAYRDSVYTVSVLYPEYIDMSASDVAAYSRLSPTLPTGKAEVQQGIVYNRKQPLLQAEVMPVVYKDGKWQLLVSFMLQVEARQLKRSQRLVPQKAAAASQRYAAHSVLATGSWAKIRVPASGVYQLTDALIRQAGFTDLTKVRVYGYGGNLQPEALSGDYLSATDDLKEVATCTVGGRRLFYAEGPVSWNSKTSMRRTRNFYSDYGYYFLTQSTDGEPLQVDSTEFLNSFYPSAGDYHSLYEDDSYSWYTGGRNLYDPNPINQGKSRDYILQSPENAGRTELAVNVSAYNTSSVSISLNSRELGSVTVSRASSEYDNGADKTFNYTFYSVPRQDTIRISCTSGGPVRLDYITLTYERPRPAPALASATFASPEYVYNITNQDLHADGPADMVIIIPTSQKLRQQAERLKAFHESNDSLRVRIVPADELYNEFSSGTPDGNAYRRYLKMLYDRAETQADMPKYLLLFGDCFWDNRLRNPALKGFSADDYLLAYESENSFNKITCYVDDGWFCLLDDGEGADPQTRDLLDVAVGRFPVANETDAKTMVDKTISYALNQNAGPWQNQLVFMGDDGNQNEHMNDANIAAETLMKSYPGYVVKKVMWDAYKRESGVSGFTYPEATRDIKQLQSQGALIMDYMGHGMESQISHEKVLMINDFMEFQNQNLPLWITASCDIMPFDHSTETIGENAVLNPNGGAVAFFGTTRTVYAYFNHRINLSYLKYVLSTVGGRPVSIGEAQRLAKNYMITSGQDRTTNKLQYSLLGDPALVLQRPTLKAVVDSINGVAVSGEGSQTVNLRAGDVARVSGHIEGHTDFNGRVTLWVRDAKELITCRLNDTEEADKPFSYYDRTKTIYYGTDSIRAGRFAMRFAVAKDISYSDGTGLINVYATNTDHTLEAHGACENFVLSGSNISKNDSIGPSIYAYLNSPSFQNGGTVNSTPYFVAQLTDEDGINTSESGIGHGMSLCIDGEMALTYDLTPNFSYDFGSYTSGSTFYSIPTLSAGAHKLTFRAWDILNNSSTAELKFVVSNDDAPSSVTIDCTQNPAHTGTTFIVTHDRPGSAIGVKLELFDTAGRKLWEHQAKNVTTQGAYTYEWNLSNESGQRLQTGVYLYRAVITSDGGSKTTKAKKLVVIGNN